MSRNILTLEEYWAKYPVVPIEAIDFSTEDDTEAESEWEPCSECNMFPCYCEGDL